ncbi:AdipoR/hemolysin-III-related protein [Dioscorea alata]|uniref:AdipoR/hemolysin-III-related protein n=1 Tax=Dioscorea alata TaxID=55571 RepID=A0ACB7UX68_DIOAL|nr:AdipoR/hemolysin-III-related protein [Dioscorea alata]
MEKTSFFITERDNKKCCSSSCEEIKIKKKRRSPSKETNKYDLVDYASLPTFLKHNEFILSYYRSEWPIKQTILSVFSIHNETLNIWTHLVGFFIFLVLTNYAINSSSMINTTTTSSLTHQVILHNNLQIIHSNDSQVSQTSLHVNQTTTMINNQETSEPITRWPFYAYMCGAMFCLLMSSACHLLSCHSEHTCYLMLRLDYAGISGLIVTSFYPLVYYSFTCHPFIRNVYLTAITVFGIATIIVSLFPVFETPEYRSVRAGLFVCMALSGLVPIMHKLMAFGDRPEAVVTAGYETIMGAFYALGVLVYAARVPERWMPGRFDLAGHSHQLFHVLVIAGAYTHYLAGLVYLRWREIEGC